MTPEHIELLDDVIGRRIAECELQFRNYKPMPGLPLKDGKPDMSGKEWLGRYIQRLKNAREAFKHESSLHSA